MERYEDHKFISRYQLSKEIVVELALVFEASGLSSTGLSTQGGGLSIEERVSMTLLYYMI